MLLSEASSFSGYSLPWSLFPSHLRLRTYLLSFFFSSRRRHTRSLCDWSSDVCSSDLKPAPAVPPTTTAAAHSTECTGSKGVRARAGSRWLILGPVATWSGSHAPRREATGTIPYVPADS